MTPQSEDAIERAKTILKEKVDFQVFSDHEFYQKFVRYSPIHSQHAIDNQKVYQFIDEQFNKQVAHLQDLSPQQRNQITNDLLYEMLKTFRTELEEREKIVEQTTIQDIFDDARAMFAELSDSPENPDQEQVNRCNIFLDQVQEGYALLEEKQEALFALIDPDDNSDVFEMDDESYRLAVENSKQEYKKALDKLTRFVDADETIPAETKRRMGITKLTAKLNSNYKWLDTETSDNFSYLNDNLRQVKAIKGMVEATRLTTRAFLSSVVVATLTVGFMFAFPPGQAILAGALLVASMTSVAAKFANKNKRKQQATIVGSSGAAGLLMGGFIGFMMKRRQDMIAPLVGVDFAVGAMGAYLPAILLGVLNLCQRSAVKQRKKYHNEQDLVQSSKKLLSVGGFARVRKPPTKGPGKKSPSRKPRNPNP